MSVNAGSEVAALKDLTLASHEAEPVDIHDAAMEMTPPPADAEPASDVDGPPPPAAAELLSFVPATRRRVYATSLADYKRRYDGLRGPLPCFPPPSQSSLQLPRHRGVEQLPSSHATPFFTVDAGGLPRGVPPSVEGMVSTYLVGGASRTPPNIDVDFAPVDVCSNGEARSPFPSRACLPYHSSILMITRHRHSPGAACALARVGGAPSLLGSNPRAGDRAPAVVAAHRTGTHGQAVCNFMKVRHGPVKLLFS